MGKVLIIDDHRVTCEILQAMVETIGHEADYRLNLHEGFDALEQDEYDVVFLDVQLPDGIGLDYIQDIQNSRTKPEVVIITGAGSLDGAEIAIKNGAWDYFQKPLSPRKILLPIRRVLEYRENKHKSSSPMVLRQDGIVGNSEEMKRVLEQVAVAACNDSNVLIHGETGTGKEVIAKTLHENSNRQNEPFIIVDCASLPGTLVESVLFGHVSGAFTGANKPGKGLIAAAEKGTLFLDEIGELSLDMQKPLLRVLQEKTIRPVGSVEEHKVDFRLIAATNRDLDKMVRERRFREDLLYRIRSTVIGLPPLRERLEDMEQLMFHHLSLIVSRYELNKKGISPDFIEVLQDYDWPGNIRELVNTMEQAIYNSGNEPIIFSKHLPKELRVKLIGKQFNNRWNTPDTISSAWEFTSPLPPYKQFRENSFTSLEKRYLEQLMAETGGDIKQAMNIAQLGKTRLYSLLKKYDIQR